MELSTGALRPWNPLASQLASTEKIASVRALALQNDRIAVGGDFVSLGGVNRQHLAALDTATGLATVWNPGADGSVYALASSPGAIYAGGIFTNVGGGVVSRLAALDPSSGQVKPFSAQVVANGTLGVFALVWKSDTLYVGGNFTGIGGTTRKNLAAVDGLTGALIAGWNPDRKSVV